MSTEVKTKVKSFCFKKYPRTCAQGPRLIEFLSHLMDVSHFFSFSSQPKHAELWAHTHSPCRYQLINTKTKRKKRIKITAAFRLFFCTFYTPIKMYMQQTAAFIPHYFYSRSHARAHWASGHPDVRSGAVCWINFYRIWKRKPLF